MLQKPRLKKLHQHPTPAFILPPRFPQSHPRPSPPLSLVPRSYCPYFVVEDLSENLGFHYSCSLPNNSGSPVRSASTCSGDLS
ncbi:hypothetical protein L484_025236 [Morus notabilis]|uniref:Uncharacterized protein n=1 Tax=Morus notabilis TaxID=981085 RepID=W9RUE1_9ROSA|nr:hypothetical protein L484_025236 [Morus notabilis]